MRKLALALALLTAVLVSIGLASASTAAPAMAAAPETIALKTDQSRISTVLGDHFSITTEVTNPGNTATGPLLAHLNVASITGSVYVDPEDWSSSRSQELSLQPGESRALHWQLQAVNSGSFAVYVVVLPFGTSTAGNEPLAVSPLIRLEVATRSTLSAGGALPVALAIPLLLGLAATGARFRLRRQR